MSRISIVLSVKDFYFYFKDILTKYGAFMFIEKKTINNVTESFLINDQNINELIDLYNQNYNLNFYITTSKLSLENKNRNFYSEEVYCDSIEGIGGRENKLEVELITLRLLSKKPEKGIKDVFNSLKSKVKKDSSFRTGLKVGTSLYKNYIYQVSYTDNKIMLIDFSRKQLFSPLVPILEE